MRKETLSLFALAALSLAEELGINDVPLACANICGPVVELSALCDLDGSLQSQELKKRKTARALPKREDDDSQPLAKRQIAPDPITLGQPRNGIIGEFKT